MVIIISILINNYHLINHQLNSPRSDEIGKVMIKHEIVISYLEKIKLEASAHNKLIGELSGGQKVL